MNNKNIQLELKNVTTVYGKNKMLLNISLQIEKGKIVSLLGSNGAGKSTLTRSILGLVKIVEGKIFFENEDITALNTHKTIAKGISIAPEGKGIFPKMTVGENLQIGAYLEKNEEEVKKRMSIVFSHFPLLKERTKQIAGTLSGGEQSMLSIGRALMGNPKLMIFDEPSLGLAPVLVKETFNIVETINKMGITVFLVEQNANMALGISDYGYFLQKGQIIASGTSEELKNQDVIKKAYFGGK
jgi:branched-chain amino acid transport system ATP-binding protein